MKIRLLNIHEAWTFYGLIKDHFPEKLGEDQIVIDFVSDLIKEMPPVNLLKALRLLLDEEEVKIEELSTKETFLLLVEGFQQNRIFELYLFFSELSK